MQQACASNHVKNMTILEKEKGKNAWIMNGSVQFESQIYPTNKLLKMDLTLKLDFLKVK